MIAGAGATGRGPAAAGFGPCTIVTCAEVRDATATTGITVVRAGDFATGVLCAVVLCAGLTRRCLFRAGTVPAKPVAASRWVAKVKAMIRDAVAKNDLIIKMQPFTLPVKSGRIVGQSSCCNIRPEQPNTQFCTLEPESVKRILPYCTI